MTIEYDIEKHIKKFGKTKIIDDAIDIKDYFYGFADGLNLMYNKNLKVESGCSAHCYYITSVSFRIIDDVYPEWRDVPFWILFPFNNKIRVMLAESKFKKPFAPSPKMWSYFSLESESEYIKEAAHAKIGQRTLTFHLNNIEELNECLLELKNLYVDEK